MELVTRVIAKGTMRLSGETERVEAPGADEIHQRIESTTFRTEFARMVALDRARMGLIESRAQLDYLCADLGLLGPSFPSWAKEQGVQVESIVSPRASHPRR